MAVFPRGYQCNRKKDRQTMLCSFCQRVNKSTCKVNHYQTTISHNAMEITQEAAVNCQYKSDLRVWTTKYREKMQQTNLKVTVLLDTNYMSK